MGHIHLAVLPTTRKWKEVVELLEGGAADDKVVTASARAAERDLFGAANDPVFVEAVRLLLSIPLAARADDFGDALRACDLALSDRPGLFEIVAASASRLDEVARRHGHRTDFGELAGRALAQTLSECIGAGLPGLFEETSEDVQAASRKLSYSKGVAILTRAFFGNLVGGSLSYWLDRVLPQQIGARHRSGRWP